MRLSDSLFLLAFTAGCATTDESGVTSCPDNQLWVDGRCEPACVDDVDCADGVSFCAPAECIDGNCEAGTRDCSDELMCTLDTCDAATGSCDHEPDSSLCDADEVCDTDAGCVPDPATTNPCTQDVHCEDGNPCTLDTCVDEQCQNTTDDTQSCDDGVFCNGAETCAAGTCVTESVVCDDALDCTSDFCNETDRACDVHADNDACGLGDVCIADAGCQPSPETCSASSDCADSDPCTIEVCNAAGYCDYSDVLPAALWFYDADGDGFSGLVIPPVEACASPGVGWSNDSDDCDDDPIGCGDDCYPGNTAPDGCDGFDQDCNGVADETPDLSWYHDADGDGFTGSDAPQVACDDPDGTSNGWVLGPSVEGDCDDDGVCGEDCYPGNDAPDVCDGLDQDCDGAIDEEPDLTWYHDADADGYTALGDISVRCDDPDGSGVNWLDAPTSQPDCDDAGACGADCNPGTSEVCGDGQDNNCGGTVDEGCFDYIETATDYIFELTGFPGSTVYTGTLDGVPLTADQLIDVQAAVDSGQAWDYTPSFQVISGTASAELLVVAGGGAGGGSYAGGGGAGGLLHRANHSISSGDYPVVVGRGGTHIEWGTSSYAYYSDLSGENGRDSVFDGLTAIGGGGGRNYYSIARSGGSGGGGSVYSTGPGGGTSGQGNAGAAGTDDGGYVWARGGGGGGAGGAPTSSSSICSTNGHTNSCVGGAGLSYDISGTATIYAEGGSGWFIGGSGPNSPTSTGGQGGNGTLVNNYEAGAAVPTGRGGDAVQNTGSGGGGGNACEGYDLGVPPGYLVGCTKNGVVEMYESGHGANGVVIIRYVTGAVSALGGIVKTVGLDTVHTYEYVDPTAELVLTY